MCIGRGGDRDARCEGIADQLGAEVDAVGQAVRLDRGARLDADLEQPLEIDGVRRPVVEDAPLWMADRADRRMARRLGHPLRELLA